MKYYIFVFLCTYMFLCINAILLHSLKNAEFQFLNNRESRIVNRISYCAQNSENGTNNILGKVVSDHENRKRIKRIKRIKRSKIYSFLFLNPPHIFCNSIKSTKSINQIFNKNKSRKGRKGRKGRKERKEKVAAIVDDVNITGNEKKGYSDIGKGKIPSIFSINKKQNGTKELEQTMSSVNCNKRTEQNDKHSNILRMLSSSFFYETDWNITFYSYKDIITYIKNNKNNFVLLTNNKEKEKDKKKTYIDTNYVYIRGRIEKKDKQSKRVFLHLLQSDKTHLTCLYEPQKQEQKEMQKKCSSFSEDPIFKYIKKLKNNSVVDIIGNIKIHGELERHNVSILESWYNKTVVEVVIRNILCVSLSLFDNSFSENWNYGFYDEKKKEDIENEKWNETEENKSIKKDVTEDVEKYIKEDEEKKCKVKPEINLELSKIKEINNVVKEDEVRVHFQNTLNHIIFNIKSKLLQKLRKLLYKAQYRETFTSKFVKTGKEGDKKTFNLLNGSEGGCNCYKIENSNLILAQSPQLYKQMLINSNFDKIFEINYSYRNEKFHTSRHLNEFLSVDIEQVLYNNYYEIIIFMYNILKELNDYLNSRLSEKLHLINFIQFKKKRKYEKNKIPQFPFVLSFCEAKQILSKHVKGDVTCSQEKNHYIFDSVHKKYVKILPDFEKEELKQNIYFESKPYDKIENIYYYNKIKKKYIIEFEEKTFFSSEHNIYKYLNDLNRDEIYRNLFQLFEKIYEQIYEHIYGKRQHFRRTVLEEQFNTKYGCDAYEKNEKLEPFYSNVSNNFNNNKNGVEVENYSFFELLNCYQQKEINVTEDIKYTKQKNKFLLDDDFSQDQLIDLYLFMKYNFQTDIFIIDQYPFWLRPFYTLNNLYDLRCTNSFDFIYKGIEIISGSQRITDFFLLLYKLLKENKNLDLLHFLRTKNFAISHFLNIFQNTINKYSTIYNYFNSFQLASPPHIGLALGFERYLMAVLNLTNIRNATFCL